MTTYTITVEHSKQQETRTAPSPLACIQAFVADNPKVFAGDTVYILLARTAAAITTRYLVRNEQQGRPPHIEVVGIVADRPTV